VSAVTAVPAPHHPDRRIEPHGWLRAAQRRSTLTAKARAVAAVLFSRMDAHATCWPSLATIAADAGYARSHSVLPALDELEAAGWLVRERRWKANGAPATTRYVAVVPAEAVDPDDPVGLPVDPAAEPGASAPHSPPAPVDNRPGPVDRPSGPYPRHGVTVTPDQGPEVPTKLPTKQQPRPRRRRRVDRRPPDWQLTRGPDGRLYATTEGTDR
jgi:hypothetical protein